MGVQVTPIPTEVVSHSLPFPFPILCFIPIPVGFPWDSRSHWESHFHAHLYSEALRYGTCSQGISQFYLHTHTFIHNRNESYLPLPSQEQLVLIYQPRRDGRLSRPWCEEYPRLRFEPATSRLQIRHSTIQPLAHLNSR